MSSELDIVDVLAGSLAAVYLAGTAVAYGFATALTDRGENGSDSVNDTNNCKVVFTTSNWIEIIVGSWFSVGRLLYVVTITLLEKNRT